MITQGDVGDDLPDRTPPIDRLTSTTTTPAPEGRPSPRCHARESAERPLIAASAAPTPQRFEPVVRHRDRSAAATSSSSPGPQRSACMPQSNICAPLGLRISQVETGRTTGSSVPSSAPVSNIDRCARRVPQLSGWIDTRLFAVVVSSAYSESLNRGAKGWLCRVYD